MKLSSVESARTAWVMDVGEVNPRGKRIYPEITNALAQEFQFCESPKTLADCVDALANNRAVLFRGGKFTTKRGDEIVVDLEIHNIGFAAITNTSTADSSEFLVQLAKWAKNQGLEIAQSRVRHLVYASTLIVCAEKDLSRLVKLDAFMRTLQGTEIEGKVGQKDFFSLAFRQEGSSGNAFFIERRLGWPFSENRYYSTALCETHTHLELLNKLEDAVD